MNSDKKPEKKTYEDLEKYDPSQTFLTLEKLEELEKKEKKKKK